MMIGFRLRNSTRKGTFLSSVSCLDVVGGAPPPCEIMKGVHVLSKQSQIPFEMAYIFGFYLPYHTQTAT